MCVMLQEMVEGLDVYCTISSCERSDWETGRTPRSRAPRRTVERRPGYSSQRKPRSLLLQPHPCYSKHHHQQLQTEQTYTTRNPSTNKYKPLDDVVRSLLTIGTYTVSQKNMW